MLPRLALNAAWAAGFKKFVMASIDPYSETWATVKGHCEHEIAQLQIRLEAFGIAPGETEHLRGRIQSFRAILKLTEPSSLPPDAFKDTAEED